MKYQLSSKWRFFLTRQFLLSAVAVLLVIGLVLTFSYALHADHKPPASGSAFTDKGSPQSSISGNSNPSNTDNASNGQNSGPLSQEAKSNTNVGVTADLILPSGNFVSNHHPSLSSQPLESSVCTTTPGASCQIIFTQDNITKELPARTTDSNGSAFWDWKLQDYGLSTGSWKVEATATLNGQNKSATDSISLEVNP